MKILSSIFNFFFLLFSGECYLKLDQVVDAERELKNSIGLTKNAMPYLSLARLYVSTNRINEAIEIYETSLK